MARAAAISVENNFIKGLITEVTGVNSPENSVSESMNVIYDRTGKARVRQGFIEENTSTEGIITPGVFTEYVWETVSNDTTITFVVTQIGQYIHFFRSDGFSTVTSGYFDFINIGNIRSPRFTRQQVADRQASFASGSGYLFIAHPLCETSYISYENGELTRKSVDIKIRDFEGVDDELDDDDRPKDLSAAHKYNLFNQGWYAEVKGENNSLGDTGNALSLWKRERGDNPANTDVWWYYTTIRADDDNGIESSDIDKFNPKLAKFKKALYGNAPAPKGHYILRALDTNRKIRSNINGGFSETSSRGYNPSSVAFYAGRVFYSGVGHQKYASKVYFSQIVRDEDQLGKCYQSNDPTSREAFDILADDGGVIDIQDVNTIIDMRVQGQTLYVFASNGVWSISGTDQAPFKATDYTVSKVSAFPALNKLSIVEVGGTPLWWNYEGIFSLQAPDQPLGSSNVTNISQTTIKTFYDAIPQKCKKTAKGCFNDQDGLIYWLYSTDTQNPYKYDRILVFDVVTTAFYPMSVPIQEDRYIVGMVAVRSVVPNDILEEVWDENFITVTNDALENVTVLVDQGGFTGKKVFKFATVSSDGYIFSDIANASYLDWADDDYDRYFITGYRVRGEMIKKFQTNYLSVIAYEEANNSCYVQGIWDYANSPDTGRYTNPQQVIRNKVLREYQRSKVKIRGNGYSLQFKFYGESGKTFTIVGWAGFETATTVP